MIKPDLVVAVDGDNYSLTSTVGDKTIAISFTLGQEYEADPGVGKVSKVYADQYA